MAADCTVIGAAHPDSAASEVIADAGIVVEPTVETVTETLSATLEGKRPESDPVSHARCYDWNAIAEQATETYRQTARR